MSLADAINAESGTFEEVLAAVKARTINEYSEVPGAILQGALIEAGLWPLIIDTAADQTISDLNGSSTDELKFRGMCDGLLRRAMPNGGVDLASPVYQAMLTAILSHPRVVAILNGSPFGSAAVFEQAIYGLSVRSVPEFPSVTMKDVVSVKDPALAQQEASNSITLKGSSDKLTLITDTAMPEQTPVYAQVSYDDGVTWTRVQSRGLTRISAAGAYPFQLNPGTFVVTNSMKVRVASPYAVGLLIEAR